MMHADTLFCIIEFLSIRDGVSLLSACKAWNELDRYEIVWKTLLSNFLKTKMSLFIGKLSSSEQKRGKSRSTKKGINHYKGILDKLKRFYQTQILKEESVQKPSFQKYMDDDEGEKSTAFGMRFKKLSESAVFMYYKLMMVGGLDEIKNEFDLTVINYEPDGFLAQYFLNHVEKFTLNGRNNDSVFANEYWKQYSFEIVENMFSVDFDRELSSEQLTSFLERFKPVLKENSLENILRCYVVRDVDENGVDKFLEFLLSYISVEGNYQRASDPFITFRTFINKDNMVILKYLKKIINVIYPNRFLEIFKNCINHAGTAFHCLEYFNPRLFDNPTILVDSLCQLLEIIEEKSIHYSNIAERNIFLQKEEQVIIELLEKRGLIGKEDYKIIFHKFNYSSKIPDLLPKIENFDPYEIIETSEGNYNFIYSVFKSYSFCSINTSLKPFFEIYPEKLDLNILTTRLKISMQSFKELINHYIVCHFLDYHQVDDLTESIEIMTNYFTPTILDVSCIERIVNYFKVVLMSRMAYPGITSVTLLDGFKYILEHIQHEGVPFDQYCKGIRNKYSTDTLVFHDFDGEERMAYLYKSCLTIIEEMPKFYAIND
ncbi:predicted protein [Naegleria gruberi]|uniref:Predicted protein n=1 Tax=Naegleria gruberi TaxID=5762 RepID=D2VS73_NAEGR|nr:uncharacterized protein NAEGRDRAFT_51840 [Naegleria gruberi]EFC40291.1 predicted protein [Naegleria gruberi]|eukprot:XP_002673035.1 predicted protein [Naegleria gruberi strain NEG-M]